MRACTRFYTAYGGFMNPLVLRTEYPSILVCCWFRCRSIEPDFRTMSKLRRELDELGAFPRAIAGDSSPGCRCALRSLRRAFVDRVAFPYFLLFILHRTVG